MADRDITLALKARDETGGAFSSFGSRVEGAKKQAKGFNETMELLKGGGALIGLMAIGNAAVAVSGEIKRINEEAARLNLNGTEKLAMTLDAVASKIPVFGQFFTAGKNLSEALGGGAAEIRKIEESTDRVNTRFAAMQKGAVAVRDAFKSVDDYVKSIERRISLIGLKPETVETRNTQFGAQDTSKELTDKFNAARNTLLQTKSPVTEGLRKDFDAAGERIKQLQAELNNVRWEPKIGNNKTTEERFQDAIKAEQEKQAFITKQISAQEQMRDAEIGALERGYKKADELQKAAAQKEIDQARKTEIEKAREATAQRDKDARDQQIAARNAFEQNQRMEREQREADIKAQREAARQEAEESRKMAQENVGIATDVAAKRLRASGQTLEAQLLEMRTRADQQIADVKAELNALPDDGTQEAKRKALKERIGLLRQQSNQDFADAARKYQAEETAPAFNGAVVRRFGAASGSGGVLAATPQIKLATEAAAERKRQSSLLQSINKYMEQIAQNPQINIIPGSI